MKKIIESNISKTFLVGDLHLGIKNNSSSWLAMQEDFLCNTFIDQCKENGLDGETDILILEGDIFHNRQTIDVLVQETAEKIFCVLCRRFKHVYVIAGNHDIYYKDTNAVSSLNSIKKLVKQELGKDFNLTVIMQPVSLVINNQYSYLMLPWENDNNVLSQTIKDYEGKCDYIICHADVKGAKFNRFVKVETGLDTKQLTKYKKIYAGHIHIRQEFTKAGAIISYTGTPYHMDRGDVGNKKGFDILTYQDGEVTETFIENKISPKYIKSNVYSLLNYTIEQIQTLFKNNFVDISVDTKIADRFNPTSFLELIGDTQPKSIEFTNYSSEGVMKVNDIAQNINDDDLNIENVFEVYCDQKSYDKLQRKLITAKFQTYLKEIRDSQKSEL